MILFFYQIILSNNCKKIVLHFISTYIVITVITVKNNDHHLKIKCVAAELLSVLSSYTNKNNK